MEDLVFISHSSADKPIADAICHRLEAGGIRCWIAPRDIRSTDWADAIMEGLHRSRIFVVVISRDSIPSPEVTKEVTEATRTCQYLLPFKVDESVLSDRLRYHLGPCHWLDAVSPPLEQRIDELIYRIRHLSEEDAVYMNRDRLRLSQQVLFPRGVFVGRDREIARIGEMLSEDHVLFLQGMGGLGKSEIAKGYARQARDRYDTIVFTSYVSGLRDLVSDLPVENLARAENVSQEQWYRRKLEAFHTLATERTLLVVDNFDTDEDSALEELIACPAHFLFTTRNDHSDYPTLKIGPIDDFDQVRRIFTAHYGRPVSGEDQETVDRILRLVDCHTITVELIAKQMKASFLRPKKMLEQLERTGVNLGLKEKVKREGEAEKRSGFDFIRRLFTLSGLSDEEKRLLGVMCLVPHSGIPAPLLGEILDLEDFDAVNSLVGKSWLSLDDRTDMLQLHPVVCDVVKAELHPSPLSCIDYVRGLYSRVRGFWNMETEERRDLYPLVSFLLDAWPEPVRELFTEYGQFGDCAWICGDYARSQAAGQRLYDFAVSAFGDPSPEAGTAALYTAAAFFNAGDSDAAEPWYRLGYRHRAAALDAHDILLGASHIKLARCARLRGDFDTARSELAQAQEIFDYIIINRLYPENRVFPGYYHEVFQERGKLLIDMGDYTAALEECRRCYEVVTADYERELANSLFPLRDMGVCCSLLGRYDEAAECFARAYELNLRLNGERSMATMNTRECIADNERRRGNREKARELFQTLELDSEKYMGRENPQTLRILGKLQELQG